MTQNPLPPISGFMLGTVVGNTNSEKKGTIKVRLACEGGNADILEEVKVAVPYAGTGHGAYCLPEVGDQVVVGFLEGAYDRPFVLASLYTAKDSMVAKSYHEKNARKVFHTKSGMEVVLSDDENEDSLRVRTKEGMEIRMNNTKEQVAVTAGKNQVVLDSKAGAVKASGEKQVSLKAGKAEMTLKADGTVILKGTKLELSGQSVLVEGKGKAQLKGQQTGVSGSQVNISSNGILKLSGSITKLN